PTRKGVIPQRPLTLNGGGTYQCADGRYVQFNPQGSSARFLVWFAHAAGVDGWAADGLFDAQRLASEPELLASLRARLAALFSTRPAQEWEDLANAAGAPLCLIRTTAEWLANEHARQSGAVVQLDDPELGPTWMAGFPVHAAGSPGTIRGPRHLPNADRDAILRELDATYRAPVAPALEPGLRRPLDGMRVVDLTQILAGPTAGRMLAEYGAEVVKINPPKRAISSHGFVNRGKQSMLLDVESAEGQRVFWKLVERADVVTQNFPRGTAERYGIGYEQVRAVKPDIVYVSVSCYGYLGPWGARRGYETQGQAATGVMERSGGDRFRPNVLGPYNLLDFGTGALAAFAGALGLYRKVTTGEGEHVQASLVQTGTYHQAAFAMDYACKVWSEPRGPDALGAGPLQRFYQASDGWFFLGARDSDLPRLEHIAGGTEEAALEAAFRQRPADDWVRQLQEAGVGAHAVVRLQDLMDDAWTREQGLSIRQVSEEAGEVAMPGLAVNMSRTPPELGAAVRQPGADGKAVLERLGLANHTEALEEAWALQTTRLPAGW
ncbi:MAG TPA: CoA transferase, partial [Chloroflexota bacterium]|nr:CoA transferase [Chloroflexota bacterium]